MFLKDVMDQRVFFKQQTLILLLLKYLNDFLGGRRKALPTNCDCTSHLSDVRLGFNI